MRTPCANAMSASALVKSVPLRTAEQSTVRISARYDFAAAPVYALLTSVNSGGASSQTSRLSQGSEVAPSSGQGAGVESAPWVCTPGYNTCELVAVVPPGHYTLAFYQPSALPAAADAGLKEAAGAGSARTCVKFGLRIQMHPTSLKYGLACHGLFHAPPPSRPPPTPPARAHASTPPPAREMYA